MSSVPFYAINTSCRTADSPRSPIRRIQQQQEASRPRSSSTSVAEKARTASTSSAGPVSPTSPVSLKLPEVRIRSSSLNQSDRLQQMQLASERDRILDVLGTFN